MSCVFSSLQEGMEDSKLDKYIFYRFTDCKALLGDDYNSISAEHLPGFSKVINIYVNRFLILD